MKKFLMASVLMAGLSAGTFAQQAQPEKRQTRKEYQKNIRQELNLSDVQYEQVNAIHKEYREKIKETRDNQQLNQEQKKAVLKSLHKERSEKINQVLTPEQQQKLAQQKKTVNHRKHGVKDEAVQ